MTPTIDGFYWYRLWTPLRGGHYHHEWLPARIEGGKVQLFGSDKLIPADAPILQNAMWGEQIEQPTVTES